MLLLDRNVARLRSADAIYQGHLQTVTSNAYEIERAVLDADLVIGAVGAVPHTSTYALTNVTLPYTLEIAGRGWREALRNDDALAQGLNTHEGSLTCAPVAEAHRLPCTPVSAVLA